METITISRIIAALKAVPAKQLKIIELVNELTGKDGQFDADALAQRQPEVNLAIAEAQAYSAATGGAFDAVFHLVYAGTGPDHEDDDDD